MATSSNDNNGLKIAIAAFATLTLLLGVTCYFLYSSYAETSVKLDEASKQKSASDQAASKSLDDFNKLLNLAYGEPSGDVAGVEAKAKANLEALTKKVGEVNTYLATNVVNAVRQEATDKKLETVPKELTDLQSKGTDITNAFAAPTNLKGINGQLDKLAELLVNTANIAAELGRDNIGLRRDLAAVNSINAADVKSSNVSRDEKAEQVDKITTENTQTQQALRARLEELQGENSSQATKINDLETQTREQTASFEKVRKDLLRTITSQRENLDRNENVLDSPDGRVISVDNLRREVRVDLTRAMGVRPKMRMSIFDRDATGIPTDKVKAVIELTQIGADASTGTVLKQTSLSDPVQSGDVVYSPVWNANEPERFALVGKMDLNRDGRDDRVDVKRMIESAGGIVDFDLPPAKVQAKETGKVSPRLARYVVDIKDPFRPEIKAPVPDDDDQKYLKRYSQVIDEARLYGVRPLALHRLAAYLGYDVTQIDRGQVQYRDDKLIDSVLFPKGRRGDTKPAAPPEAGAIEEAAPGADPN